MARSLLRFRCYQCSRLLGVSPSKAGKVVACPSCKAELIVPEPEPETEAEQDVVDESIQLQIETTESIPSDRHGTPTPVVPDAVEVRPTHPEGATPAAAGFFDPAGDNEPGQTAEPSLDLLGIQVEPVEPVLPIAVAPVEAIGVREATYRSRDVHLPRGVVAAWSILVLLAVVASFVAGLLIGHFVWKGV